jgi:MFS family permease
MLRTISRNNRLFMLGNFLFALSYGLWMNLRQIHLLDLGASPAQIGTVFALVAVAGGLLPLPAGVLADRIGPKRVIIASWLLACAGAVTAALARGWPVAGAGYIVFMLCIAANPATVSYVLLNAASRDGETSAEGVMATVFASWPAAMIIAPALGGVIADRWSIQADLWIGALGLLAAVVVVALAGDSQPTGGPAAAGGRALAHNSHFVLLAIYFSVALIALYLGFALAPTYLEDARGYTRGAIGLLFSIASFGALLFRSVVIRFRARLSFAILLLASGLGMVGLWQTQGMVWNGAAFLLLGGISTTWVVMQATIGRVVPEHGRGLALGITESMYYGGIALASWLAGQLYVRTPAHDLALVYGAAATVVVLACWAAVPLRSDSHRPSAARSRL